MKVRDVNRAFLIIICVYLAGACVMGVFAPAFLDTSAGSVLTAQVLILGGTILCCMMMRLRPVSFMRLRPVKCTAVLCGIGCTACLYPYLILVSSLTQQYFRSGTDAVSEALFGGNLPVNLIIYALLPACAEEIMNRGLLYRGYRQTCGVWTSVILSSLLFGLFHMNLDQFMYTFLFGMFLCLLSEASDSLFPCMICHTVLNAITVLAAWISGTGACALRESDLMCIVSLFSGTAGVLSSAAVLFTAAAAGCLLFYMLLRCSGRREAFVQAFTSGAQVTRIKDLITPELIIGAGICILYMILYEVTL